MLLDVLYITGAVVSISAGVASIVSALKAKGYQEGAERERKLMLSHIATVEKAQVTKDIESFLSFISVFSTGCTSSQLQGINFREKFNPKVREHYTRTNVELRRLGLHEGENANDYEGLEESVNTFCIATNSSQRIDAGRRLYRNLTDLQVKIKQSLQEQK